MDKKAKLEKKRDLLVEAYMELAGKIAKVNGQLEDLKATKKKRKVHYGVVRWYR